MISRTIIDKLRSKLRKQGDIITDFENKLDDLERVIYNNMLQGNEIKPYIIENMASDRPGDNFKSFYTRITNDILEAVEPLVDILNRLKSEHPEFEEDDWKEML